MPSFDDDDSKKFPSLSEPSGEASDFLEPALELPPSAIPASALASRPSTNSGLFDENITPILTKFNALDAFVRLSTRDLKFQEFIREILLIFLRACSSEAESILEVDHKTNTLFFRAVVGQSSDTLANFVIPMGQGVVGYVAESRQPIAEQKVEESKMHLKSIPDAVGFKTKNLVAIPIVIRGQIYGVLELLNRLGEPNYSKEDVELLTYLCEMAAKVIEVRMMLSWVGKYKSKKEEAA